MSNDDYIKNTYGFQDENITIDKFDAIIINDINHNFEIMERRNQKFFYYKSNHKKKIN